MGAIGIVIAGLVMIVVTVLVMRLFGAWMLRIDEVIKYQKEILSELRRANDINDDDGLV